MDGITLEGGGYAQLCVIRMSGIYFLCGSVIMSILLSLIVDAVDESDRTRIDEEFSNREKEINELGNDLQLTTNNPPNQAFLDHPGIHRPVHVGRDPLASRTMTSSSINIPHVPMHQALPSPTTNSRLLKQTMMIVLSLISLPLVGYAVSLPVSYTHLTLPTTSRV